MTIYNYEKTSNITSNYYPIHTHLCVEYNSYVYFVPFQNTLTIRKLDPSDGSSSLITTKTGTIIKFYLDRTNAKLYFVHSLNTVAYIDLSDDSVSSDYTTTTDDPGTLGAIEDIIIYGSDLFIVDTSQDDLTFYKYDSIGVEWDNVGTIAEGASNEIDINTISGSANGDPIELCFDGTYFYITDQTDGYVYKYNAVFDTLVGSIDVNTISSGDNDHPGAICWDGSYFYVVDTDFNHIFKYNAAFDTLVDEFNVPSLIGLYAISIEWDGTYFYILETAPNNTVYQVNTTFSSIIDSFNIGALGGNDNPQSIVYDNNFFYVTDNVDKYIYKYDITFSYILDTYDIGILGGNDNPTGIGFDDNFFYVIDATDKSVYQYSSDLKSDIGQIEYSAIISDKCYVVYQYPRQDAKIYVKDLDDSSNPSLLETISSDYIIPYLENQRGISVSSDNDTLYFVLKDTTDGLTYLCTYVITTDTFTVKGEYNVALMLDRNTNTSNNPPFNLEKGFHLTSLYIYQIAQSKGNLYKISDLTNNSDFTSHVIKGITDTYVISYNGSTSQVSTFQDFSNYIIEPLIYYSERSYPTATLEYRSDKLFLEDGMFVQMIGNIRINGSTAVGVRFEGYVVAPEDEDEEAVYTKTVDLINPSYFDLKGNYAGKLAAGSFDDWLDTILSNWKYMTKGTFDAGTLSLPFYTRNSGKDDQQFIDQGAIGEGFTWRIRPTGIMDWTDGTDDSGLDYDQSTPIWDVTITKKKIRPNSITVKGGYFNSVQITSESDHGQDLPDQQQYGIIPLEVNISWISTVALANSYADTILALVNQEYIEVIFSVQDTTNGFVPPAEEITLADSNKGITSAQYKINNIVFNDKTNIAEYTVSSVVRWDEEDLKFGFEQDLSDLIDQVNERTNIKTGWDSGFSYSDATISFTNGTRTFTITPVTSTISYWINGKKYVVSSAQTVVITDTEGLWFIYFSGDTLTASQTVWTWADGDFAPVAVVYWDATNNQELGIFWEFHSYEKTPADHSKDHHTIGTVYASGFTLTEAAEQITLTAGIIYDEDIRANITDGATTALFEQPLSPVEGPVFYKSGASTAWRKHAATTYPFYDNAGGDNVHFNQDSGGTWSSTAATTTAKYINYWCCATSEIDEPIFYIMGQDEYNTIAAARDIKISDLDLTGLPFQEIKFLYQIIIKSDSTYQEAIDLRTVQTPGGVYTPPDSQISDEAFGSTWDGVTTIGASKNVLYDYIKASLNYNHYVLLQDQKAQNTAGGTFTAGDSGGVWGYQRVLNTEISDPGSHCSLSSNRFTLDAGTYYLRARGQTYSCGVHMLALYNYSDSSFEAKGDSFYSHPTNGGSTPAVLECVFTIASSKALEIRHKCSNTRATNGFGLPSNLDTEKYLTVEIFKVG